MLEPTDSAYSSWARLAEGHYDDADELVELLRGWDIDFRQLTPGSSGASLLQFGSPNFMVSRFSMDQPFDQRGSTPPGMVTLGLTKPTSGKVFTPEGVVAGNEMWCFSAGREFQCVSEPNWSAFGLSFSEALLDEVADACGLEDVRSVLGSNQVLRCGTDATLDDLRIRLEQLSHCLSMNFGDSASCYPTRSSDLERDLVRQALESLAKPPDKIGLPLSHRKQLVLRRLLEYLEAHSDTCISVQELSKVVGASVRMLEYLFRDYFGITPKTYLKNQRLIGVRRELLRADAAATRVKEIAHRWDFWHLGQFAHDYHSFFGELPSETLKRTP